MNGILSFLRNRQDLAGRLLLLSDRVVEEARWSEWIAKRTLTKLGPEESVTALETKFKEAGVTAEIAAERKKEVVRDLDFNPRAIEALVGALRYDSLDEIIESNPGLWAVRDRGVSRDFLKALERDLLERTMRHLDEVHQRKLWRLAAHRRSFKREALEKLCANTDEAADLRSILVTRYLLNFYRGALALNPIVREISLSHLRDDPAQFQQAHSAAADYHMRHFKAKQMVGTQSKLGESFAELRYHLTQAGREAELSVIGQCFTKHLKREINSVSPVPTDREELDERIGVLTVLLGKAGAKGLEYHLARCLQSRRKPNDLKLAALHAACATGVGAPAASWYLRAELENQAEGLDAAMRTIYEAIHKVSVDDALVTLFQLGAELLASANRGDEAVALLKEGIKVIPPDKSLFSLYQMLGEVHCRAEQVQDAIAAQREGLCRIPAQFGGYKLVEGALYLCAASAAAQTLAEIVSGTGASAIAPPQVALGNVLKLQMTGDWQAVAAAAGSSRREIPRVFMLAIAESFSQLAAGFPEEAWRALSSFPNLTFGVGEPNGWLATFIHLRRGARPEAAAALATDLGRPVDESRELNEAFLLRLWDQQEVAPESHRLCFMFPHYAGVAHGTGPFNPPCAIWEASASGASRSGNCGPRSRSASNGARA